MGVYVANELEKDVSLGRFASKLADAARSASPGERGARWCSIPQSWRARWLTAEARPR